MSAMLINVQTAEIVASSEPIVVKATTENVSAAAKNLALSLLNPGGAVTETHSSVANVASKQTAVANKKNPVAENGYVDLGLPNGTLWKFTNESGYYTYDEAVTAFGNKLPTKEQWEELKGYCKWTWTGDGYKVEGSNGNYIILPAAGYRHMNGMMRRIGSGGSYWSSTPSNRHDAWSLRFKSSEVYMDNNYRTRGHSVRLVQQ